MKSLFRTIVSIVLSLTFVISYLNINSDVVSADTINVLAGTKYLNSKSDERTFIFTPNSDGYYAVDGTSFPLVFRETGEEYDEWIRSSCAIALDLDKAFGESGSQEVFFLEQGESYRIDLEKGEKFEVRKSSNYFVCYPNTMYAAAYLDQPFTLSLEPYSTVPVDNVTYEWMDIDEGLNYTEPSATFNLTDLLDDNYVFHSGTYNEGYDPYAGDFSTGWVTCLVTIEYNGKEYYTNQIFEVTGFRSDLRDKCRAYTDGGYIVNYHEAYNFGHPIITATASVTDPGIAISYQWYKKDPTKVYSGIYEADKKYYTKLNGYNTNEIWMSESLLQACGEPYVYHNEDGTIELRTDLVCVVTFTKGDKTYIKALDSYLGYMLQNVQAFNTTITTQTGTSVNLPADGKYFGEEGCFMEPDMPEGFELKYSWYNFKSVPNSMGGYGLGVDEELNVNDEGVELIGTGRDKVINTNNLTKFNTPYGEVSYVACVPEIYYNNQRVNSIHFSSGYFVFDIHYCDIKINRQPMHYEGVVGSTAKFHVDAEGEDLQYQWQLKKGNSWANLTSGGAATDTLSVKVDETKDGKCYRCLITDKNGSTVSTDEVYLWIAEPDVEIINQPVSYVGQEGSTAKFHVDATGDNLSYQWQLKKGSSWADLSTGGAKTDTLSIKVDASKNGKTYRCLVFDRRGISVATEEVTITVKEPDIKINTQPVSYVGPEGLTAKFSVSAEGEGLNYQWQLKKGSSWANLSSGGAKTSTMSIKVDASKNGKTYRCLITNAAGEQLATDEVKITVKDPDINITSQPESFSGLEGSTAKFTVAAEGEGLTYQWQLKKGSSWADLSTGGAKTSSMSVKADASKNGKTYRCVITNAAGEQLPTNEVTITVKQPSNAIVITKQPTDASTIEGGTLGLTVEAEGEGLTYQWQLKKGSSWANLTSGGANTNWLSLGKCDLSKNGKVYRCVITDVNGEQVVTREAKITVWYETPVAVPQAKALEPAGQENITEPVADTANEASSDPVSQTSEPAPAESPAPAEAPVDPPVESPAEETA